MFGLVGVWCDCGEQRKILPIYIKVGGVVLGLLFDMWDVAEFWLFCGGPVSCGGFCNDVFQ